MMMPIREVIIVVMTTSAKEAPVPVSFFLAKERTLFGFPERTNSSVGSNSRQMPV